MKCPICETPMKKEKRELQKGIFAMVEVCPRCEDKWIDEKGYEALDLKEGSDLKLAGKENSNRACISAAPPQSRSFLDC